MAAGPMSVQELTRTTTRRGRLVTTAAVAVGVFVALTVTMDWIPNPLNPNLAHTSAPERLPGTLIHAGVGLGVVAATLAQRPRLMLGGALWYTVVLVSAALNWWLPYLTGITVGEVDETTIREYADNPRILPMFDGRPIVPDVQHLLIHASILAACVLTWAATVQVRRRRR